MPWMADSGYIVMCGKDAAWRIWFLPTEFSYWSTVRLSVSPPIAYSSNR